MSKVLKEVKCIQSNVSLVEAHVGFDSMSQHCFTTEMNMDHDERSAISGTNCLDELVEDNILSQKCSRVDGIVLVVMVE